MIDNKKEIIFPKLLDIKEVCDILGLGKDCVYTMIHKGDIPSVKFGKRYKILAEGLLKYIESHTYLNNEIMNINQPKKRGRRSII